MVLFIDPGYNMFYKLGIHNIGEFARAYLIKPDHTQTYKDMTKNMNINNTLKISQCIFTYLCTTALSTQYSPLSTDHSALMT